MGDITLRSYDSAGDLYETWTLEHARAISYSVMDDSESGVPTVQLAFSFLAIQTTFYEDGVEGLGGGASRLDVSGETIVASGGGTGPERHQRKASAGSHRRSRACGSLVLLGNISPVRLQHPSTRRPRAQLFDMRRELDHLAQFLHMAVDYAKEIGFTGQFYIEPKPKEPTKHQYDSDAAACLNFLRQYDLLDHLKLNLETNHATLAGHTMQHELEVTGAAGALGSIDANTGDMLLGWDTDQFPTDIYLTTQCMHSILRYGGLTTGGVNFDAKVRRESFEPIDLYYAHIGGMDAFARGLKIAAAIRADGRLDSLVKDRYANWDSGLGAEIEAGKHSLASLEKIMLEKGEAVVNRSGRQEMIENLINTYL